jgi:hypothetical protein
MVRTALAVTLAAGASVGGALGALAPSAGAAVNGHCGVVDGKLAAGQSLRIGGLESDNLHIYTEVGNKALSTDLRLDLRSVGTYKRPSDLPATKPILGPGTHVNSYLLHSDPVGQPATFRRTATIGFTSDILGVQILGSTIAEAASHQVRFPGVQYPNTLSGLDLAPEGTGDYARLINARTLSVSFKTSNAIDGVRIITKVATTSVSGVKGYRILAADGGVFDFGGQRFYGSTGDRVLNQPIVSGVNTCGNAGYWFVARDGGVFSYGDARFYGSLGGTRTTSPVTALAATPSGGGYFLAQANGAVHAYGDASLAPNKQHHNDLSYLKLNSSIVGMSVTPSGNGYWLLGSDGGIFSFGDAEFYGSTGALRLVSPVVGFAPSPSGKGYFLYAADGGIFSFGDAVFRGSVGGAQRTNPIVGLRMTGTGRGYWITDSAGVVFNFGDAVHAGDMRGVHLVRPMIGMM